LLLSSSQILLQVEDFGESGHGTKSAGHEIEGGTTTYRELSPRAGPEKGAGPAERAPKIGALSSPIRKRIGNVITFKVQCPYRIVHRPQMSQPKSAIYWGTFSGFMQSHWCLECHRIGILNTLQMR
jgi:hypothetical protein